MKFSAKRVTNRLIVASVAILGALGVVRLAGYYVVKSELDLAMETGRLVDEANEQRALGQMVVRLAYEDGANLAELKSALERMGQIHRSLATSQAVGPDVRARLEAGELALTHIQVAGSDIVDNPVGAQRKAAQNEILAYQHRLDLVMKSVQGSLAEAEHERMAKSQRAHTWMLAVGIAFITAAVVLVAVPLRNLLVRALDDLVSSQKVAQERADELDELRLELEKANEELKERHVRLRKAYDESSSANKFLTAASARFEDLFHGVPFACFSVDADGIVFEWNEAASNMFGAPGHETIQKTIFGKYFSVENDFLLKSLIGEAFRGHHLTNIEMIAECPGGQRRLLVSVFPLKAARQEPTAALIACADITLQKEAEDKVAAILDSIKDAFVTLDKDLVYRYVNNTAAEWLGMEPKDIIGRSLLDVTPTLEGTDFYAKIAALAESEAGDSFEHFFEDSNVWLEFRVYPSKDGVSVFYNDITVRKADEETIRRQREQLEQTMLKLNENSVLLEQQQLELEEANRNLQELATTDGLTGLRNHRAMQDELKTAVKRSARSGLPVSVALLDVDHFKKFNDSFGHQAGDVVLRELAKILKASVRDTDIVARYGGEEFCIILPETDQSSALAVCERIRRSVERSSWEHREVTVSIGVSTATDVHDLQGFLKQADEALYDAKGAGRNCVRTYRERNYRCA